MPSYDEFVNMRSRAEAAEADRDRLLLELVTMREVARGNKRHAAWLTVILERVGDLTVTTDGDDLDADAEIPAGEIRRALTEPIEAASGSLSRAQAPAAEQVARLFHETYERLAPEFGYRTREASAKPWAEVPESNRALMVATCAEVLAALAAPATGPSPRAFLGEPVCGKPGCPCRGGEPGRPVDLWLGPSRRDTVRLADIDLHDQGQA